jgi:hypothetical protein
MFTEQIDRRALEASVGCRSGRVASDGAQVARAMAMTSEDDALVLLTA